MATSIDFPNAPTVGQQYTTAGVTWVWDGAKWTPAGLTTAVAQAMNDNRIINGDMRIDQRNNGASGTAVNAYTIDRWKYGAAQAAKGTWQRLTPGPSGFPYVLSFQASSSYASVAGDYFYFAQFVEADQVSDFAWGTAQAQPVTLSFWVYSNNLTGTFSGAVSNANVNRSYPFTYSVPAANTWYKIIVTVPGDTGSTWTLNGNGAALSVIFDLGSGTNFRGAAGAWASANLTGVTGAVSIVSTNTAMIIFTGVKLEIGSIATPFNRQSLAKSMADCQRYYQYRSALGLMGYHTAGNNYGNLFSFPTMRAIPAITFANISYTTNSSGLTAYNIVTSNVTYYVSLPATGNTFATFDAILSAEL